MNAREMNPWPVLIIVGLVVGLGIYFTPSDLLKYVVPAILVPIQFIGAAVFFFIAIVLIFHSTQLPAFRAVYIVLVSYVITLSAFGTLYFDIYRMDHNAFNREIDLFTACYFSITTMATVGFGDIYPVSALARCAVCMQIFVGLMYNLVLFAMIAAVLSVKLAERWKDWPED